MAALNEIAATILAQLGGNRFCAMTGAKNFVQGTSLLQFDLPRNSGGVNRVQVVLHANDLYTVACYKWSRDKLSLKDVGQHSHGVYADQLQEIFTAKTGLYTRL